MSFGEVVKKAILPLIFIAISLCFASIFAVKKGECNYIKLVIIAGFPFGITKIKYWISVVSLNIPSMILQILVKFAYAGVIGSFVMAKYLITAIWIMLKLVGYLLNSIFKRARYV